MYFIAEEAWEITNPLVKALPGSTGSLFSCVEVDLNIPLWHLDILVEATTGMNCWRRFLLTSLEQAAVTAALHKDKCVLYFQSSRSSQLESSYAVFPVKKVLAGHDSNGRPVHKVILPQQELLFPRSCGNSKFSEHCCLYEASEI